MRTRLITAIAVATVAFAAPRGMAAQVVGRLPSDAVLRDLPDGQRFGPYTGWLTTGRDPLGLRTHSAPIVGLRYDVAMSGPAYFGLRMFAIRSKHDVYDPASPEASRFKGTAPSNQLAFDASFQLALTGRRSWRGMQPLVNLGFGVISGVANQFDAGLYAPGTSALYSYGMGMRFPTGRNGELRADVNWFVHQVRYPNRFRTTTVGDAKPLRADGTMTPLTTNRAMTVAWSWGIFR